MLNKAKLLQEADRLTKLADSYRAIATLSSTENFAELSALASNTNDEGDVVLPSDSVDEPEEPIDNTTDDSTDNEVLPEPSSNQKTED